MLNESVYDWKINMKHIKHKQDILHRVKESRKAIKQEYDILKREQVSMDEILNRTFKPMSVSLEKLVSLTAENHTKP